MRRWWWRRLGKYKYPDKGNMTKPEIDMTMAVLTEAKKSGQFRAFWKDFNESVNLMASGETVIQSMWSPAVTAVKSKGIPCVFQPLKEGYRSWASGFAVSKGVSGMKEDVAYEFVNWFLSGWAGAYLNRQGYYSGSSADRQGRHGALRVGLLDGGQARREGYSRRPTAPCSTRPAARATAVPSTSGWAAVACWNAVMDENDYMVRKWNEFIAA